MKERRKKNEEKCEKTKKMSCKMVHIFISQTLSVDRNNNKCQNVNCKSENRKIIITQLLPTDEKQ